MVKIITEVNGKKYELVDSNKGCDDCQLRKRCKHWTVAPKWRMNILCLKLSGVWKEVDA